MSVPLLLDLAGRLHDGDRVLPWVPASSMVGGNVPEQAPCGDGVWQVRREGGEGRALVSWRETTMEAHQRQRGK